MTSAFVIGICPVIHKKTKTIRVFPFRREFIRGEQNTWKEVTQTIEYLINTGIFSISTDIEEFPASQQQEREDIYKTLEESYAAERYVPGVVYEAMFSDENEFNTILRPEEESFQLHAEECLFFARDNGDSINKIGFRILFKTIFSDLDEENTVNSLLNPQTTIIERIALVNILYKKMGQVYSKEPAIDRHFCSKIACIYNFCYPEIKVEQQHNKNTIQANTFSFLVKLTTEIANIKE